MILRGGDVGLVMVVMVGDGVVVVGLGCCCCGGVSVIGCDGKVRVIDSGRRVGLFCCGEVWVVGCGGIIGLCCCGGVRVMVADTGGFSLVAAEG